ncbi:MAG: hypothetical protein U0797_08985 [Gemmataceae bacterium]
MFPPDADLGEQRHGDVVATLAVRVAEQALAPGRAKVRYLVSIEGPTTLQIDPPRLEDAFAAWRVGAEWSSWAGDGRARVDWLLGLEQTKPGAVPLPGVRLRVRGGPSEGWHDVTWPDPLHATRDVAPIVELPPLPPSPWPARLQGASLAVLLTLAAALLARRFRRREPVVRPLTPTERAEARLAASADLEAITTAVRDFHGEHTGLPAARMTTAELLTALGDRGYQAEGLRRLLEQGDLVKFAGLPATPAQVEEARALAVGVVRDLATWASGETRAPGEGR